MGELAQYRLIARADGALPRERLPIAWIRRRWLAEAGAGAVSRRCLPTSMASRGEAGVVRGRATGAAVARSQSGIELGVADHDDRPGVRPAALLGFGLDRWWGRCPWRRSSARSWASSSGCSIPCGSRRALRRAAAGPPKPIAIDRAPIDQRLTEDRTRASSRLRTRLSP